MPAKKIDPRKAFVVGRSFSRAAEILIEQQAKHREENLLHPTIVNSVFAVEVFFKSLLALEGKPSTRGHSLKALFGKLDSKHRNAIEAAYNALVAKSKYAKRLEAGNPLWKHEVGPVLEAADAAFEDWRYQYEYEETKSLLYYGFEDFRRAVECYILDLNPKWCP
jgi:HEPN domain-containing protein